MPSKRRWGSSERDDCPAGLPVCSRGAVSLERGSSRDVSDLTFRRPFVVSHYTYIVAHSRIYEREISITSVHKFVITMRMNCAY